MTFLIIIIFILLLILMDQMIHIRNKVSDLTTDMKINKLFRQNMTDKQKENSTIQIKYHDKDIEKLIPFSNGDMIDLRSAEDYDLKAGEYKLINLGVSMKLPVNHYAILLPRSSTFKHYGIIQVNSVGIIDNSYGGDSDIWMMPVYATRDTHIDKNIRIAQFTIMRKESFTLKEVEHLSGKNRGGFGTSGKN